MNENVINALENQFDEAIKALNPFDVGAWIGVPASGFVAYPRAGDLTSALKLQNIPNALVSHKAAELLDAVKGNEVLVDSLPELPGCYGTMMLLPPDGGEIPDLGIYLDSYIAAGIRACRIAPKTHRYTLRLPAIPQMLTAVAQRGLPLFIPIGQTNWEEIAGIAKACPSLAIVVEGVGHHEFLNIRTCLSLLESTPNLLIVTTSLFLCGGLELLVNRLGKHRLFFSSNQPMDDPAAGLSLLVYSSLPFNVREQIANGNARELINSVGRGGYLR